MDVSILQTVCRVRFGFSYDVFSLLVHSIHTTLQGVYFY